jgi:hypothetical protein
LTLKNELLRSAITSVSELLRRTYLATLPLAINQGARSALADLSLAILHRKCKLRIRDNVYARKMSLQLQQEHCMPNRAPSTPHTQGTTLNTDQLTVLKHPQIQIACTPALSRRRAQTTCQTCRRMYITRQKCERQDSRHGHV